MTVNKNDYIILSSNFVKPTPEILYIYIKRKNFIYDRKIVWINKLKIRFQFKRIRRDYKSRVIALNINIIFEIK